MNTPCAFFARPYNDAVYADTEGVTEALKADDPMAWVRKMNGIRNRANEIVMQEIVYG